MEIDGQMKPGQLGVRQGDEKRAETIPRKGAGEKGLRHSSTRPGGKRDGGPHS